MSRTSCVNRTFISLLVCIQAVSAGCAHHARKVSMRQEQAVDGKVCIVPGWFGLVVGKSTDRDVVNQLGEGLFRSQIGMNGGRYYADALQSLIVVSQTGSDGILTNLTVSRSQETPQLDRNNIPVSPRLNNREGFGSDRNLRVGSSRKEMLRQLGEARQDTGNPTVWFYDIRCAADDAGPIQLIVVFEQDRLVSVTFSQR